MKGYLVGFGYMGWVPELNRYVLFATESEYEEYYLGTLCGEKYLKEDI